MPFTPPHFKDVAKKSKDLFSKKYDYKNELTATNNTDAGVTMEVGSTYFKDSYLKASWKTVDVGAFEGEIHTDASASATKAKATFDQFSKGASVAVTASSAPTFEVEASYAMDKFATKAIVTHSSSALGLNLSACVGMDGYVVGANALVDATGGNAALKSLDFAAQANIKLYQVALKTSKNQSDIALTVWNQYSKTYQWGVSANSGKNYSFALAQDMTLNKNTSIKTKVSSCGSAAAVVEHRLSDPAVKIALSTEYTSLTSLDKPAQKFGLSMAFGDY